MTKEQKILFIFVLAIAASSATFYVVKEKNLELDQETAQITQSEKQPANTVVANGSSEGEDDENEASENGTTQGTTSSGAGSIVPTSSTGATQSTKTLKQSLVYNVPDHMQEKITVTLVVDQTGKIVDAAFAYDTPTNRESADYLSRFSGKFTPSLVTGKKVSDVSLSRLGGASLTTRAFNSAVASIATQL